MSSYLDCKVCEQFGEHKQVRQFIKGVLEKRPSFSKYPSTWDVDIVLEYLESFYPHDKLTFKELSYKLVMLLALLSAWATGSDCTQFICVFTENE